MPLACPLPSDNFLTTDDINEMMRNGKKNRKKKAEILGGFKLYPNFCNEIEKQILWQQQYQSTSTCQEKTWHSFASWGRG